MERNLQKNGLVNLLVRDIIREGLVVGPDILAGGMPITTSRGHLYYLGLVADNEAEVRRAANTAKENVSTFSSIICWESSRPTGTRSSKRKMRRRVAQPALGRLGLLYCLSDSLCPKVFRYRHRAMALWLRRHCVSH